MTAWKVVTNGLQPLTWEIVAAVAAVAMLVRGRRRVPIFVLAAIFGTVGLYDLVKVGVGRARPTVPTPLVHPFGASFPSGHAMMSATAMTLVVMLCWQRVTSAAALTAAVSVAALVALAVAFSRLVLGAHYLSDVLGGWLLAGFWVSLLAVAFGIGPSRPVSRPEPKAVRPDSDRRPAGSGA